MKQPDRLIWVTVAFSLMWLNTTSKLEAQIIPDRTLPNNSIVIPNGNSIRIEGGTTSGNNLFHSFQEFSVPIGSEAFLNNGLDIQNIFSRVTGSNISNIDGLIRANGTANLFLINPNGIIFGQNAQLNIGGSFLGSTASSIRFVDGSEFSATNPTAPSLLTINVPIGLQFGTNPGSIVNRSQATAQINFPPLPVPLPFDNKVGLAVTPGQTLALVGGDIQLDGGNLTAFTGQILLGSVASPGLVSFSPTPFGLTLNYDNITNFGDIQISNGSAVNTSGLGGGKVDIRGGNVTVSGARIYGLTVGNIDGRGIDINAQNLRVEGGTQIFTPTLANGKGSDINIRATNSVDISGLGIESYLRFYNQYLASGTLNPFDPQIVLITGTVGSGASGDLNIDTGHLLLRDGVVSGTATLGAGNGGNMTIRANTIEIVSSAINNGTAKESTGEGGNINVEAQHLIMRDGSYLVSTSRSNAASGNIAIKTSESVELSGSLAGSLALTVIGTNSFDGNGKAGDLTIDTKRLRLFDGGVISSATGVIFGEVVFSTNGGLGGNLTVTASDSIELSGETRVLGNSSFAASSLITVTTSSSRGGDITLRTPVLTLRDGGAISAASLAVADAGNITINADRLELQGIAKNRGTSSTIDASVGIQLNNIDNPNATGNAGSLNLNVRELIVKDGATVTVQALGTGRAGNINAIADSIALDTGGSFNGTTGAGAGANINLQAWQIQLRRNSRIATDAGNSTGGDININTDTLAALANSDITANAQQGAGGRVSITARGIFGTQFRDNLTPQSDITATSDLGPQFSGTVEINTPDVDPSSGLVEISPNFEDVSSRIASACPASGENSFTITGRGGLPPDPTQTLPGRSIWRDVRSLRKQGSRGAGEQGGISTVYSLIEATGWQRNQKGEVELVTNAFGESSGSAWNRVAGCGG